MSRFFINKLRRSPNRRNSLSTLWLNSRRKSYYRKLNGKINRDRLIAEIVYQLYGLTPMVF
ncbi:MAG: hypothetical protein ACRC6M_19155, partial [Microcystaceae cyanobacterium]